MPDRRADDASGDGVRGRPAEEGTAGYVVKDEAFDDVMEAIRDVMTARSIRETLAIAEQKAPMPRPDPLQ